MLNLNKVSLIGTLKGKPYILRRKDARDCAVATLVTDERWMKDGREHRRIEEHSLRAFGRLAQSISKFWKEGATVSIDGSIRTVDGERVIYVTHGFTINQQSHHQQGETP